MHQGHDDRIELTVPLRGSSLATVRLIAAALGADQGFSVDEIEDTRLALNEAFALLLDSGAALGRATIDFTRSPGALRVRMWADDHRRPAPPDELTARILDAVVDSFAVHEDAVEISTSAAELSG